MLVSKLVGTLSPVNHKRLHKGWTQTSLCLQIIHFTNHHTTSHDFFYLAYLYSAGTQHGNLHLAEWPVLFYGPTQEPCVSHSQHRKNRERFWKNAGEWTGSVEISKEENSLAVSVACMAIYWPNSGLKGRTFKLCVLTRWVFNFCVRSSPMRGHLGRLLERDI